MAIYAKGRSPGEGLPSTPDALSLNINGAIYEIKCCFGKAVMPKRQVLYLRGDGNELLLAVQNLVKRDCYLIHRGTELMVKNFSKFLYVH